MGSYSTATDWYHEGRVYVTTTPWHALDSASWQAWLRRSVKINIVNSIPGAMCYGVDKTGQLILLYGKDVYVV